MKILVLVKRVVDFNVKIRAKVALSPSRVSVIKARPTPNNVLKFAAKA